MADSPAVVWRPRDWPLRTLTAAQYAFWESEGYVVLEGFYGAAEVRALRESTVEMLGRLGPAQPWTVLSFRRPSSYFISDYPCKI